MNLLSDLEIRELRLIIELSERGSFTHAAERLHMSQSAFSRAVNDVEKRLGAPLFTRTTRSVQPTALGVEFVALARELLDHHATMLRRLRLFEEGRRGTVKLATLPSFAASVMPGLLVAVQQHGITVQVIDTGGTAAVDQLLQGRVDLAVTADLDISGKVDFMPLYQDRFQLMCRPGHHFSGRTSVDWEEVAAEPLILPRRSSSVRVLVDRILANNGITSTVHREAQSVGVIAAMVDAGLGVTVMPTMVAPLMRSVRLDVVDIVNPTVDRTLGLLTVVGQPLAPAAQRLARLLIDHADRARKSPN